MRKRTRSGCGLAYGPASFERKLEKLGVLWSFDLLRGPTVETESLVALNSVEFGASRISFESKVSESLEFYYFGIYRASKLNLRSFGSRTL